nr:MAK10-like protein [Tanacetum cinerariifolium]
MSILSQDEPFTNGWSRTSLIEYVSLRTDEAGGKWYTFKPEKNNLGDTYNPSWRSQPNRRLRQPQNSQNNFSNPPNRFQHNGSISNHSFNNRPQSFNNQSNLEGLVSNFMASQDTRLSKFEADFKQQQSEMTNKIDIMLKAITDRIAGALPSDTWSSWHSVLHGRSQTSLIEYASLRTDEAGGKWYTFKPEKNNLGDTYNPSWRSHPNRRRTIAQAAGGKLRDKNDEESWALLEDLALYNNESWNDPTKVVPIASERRIIEHENQFQHPERDFVEYASMCTDEAENKWYTFKPEDNNLGDTYNPSWKSYPNLRLGDSKPFDTLADLGSCGNLLPLKLFKELKVRLLEETDDVLGLTDGTRHGKRTYMPITSRERIFLATANSVIDCKKAKIAIGEGLTRSIFGVKELDFGDAYDQVEFRRISLTGFRSCASRSQTGASQSRQST